MRSRGWCFTINNYTDDDIAFATSLYEDYINCTYLIIGFEKGRSGTSHIQGYVYFTNPVRNAWMAQQHSKWHYEAQKSKTNVKAYVYCMEDNDYYEMGERPRQGHRTDLEVIKYDIKNGVPMKDISNNYFSQWCQYRRAFDEFKNMNTKYDTQIHVYDSEDLDYSMWYIYKNYNMTNVLLLYSQYDMLINELMSKYYSGKYEYIIVPSGIWPQCLSKNVTYNIENAKTK